ncbi:MAG: hypothetical protein JWN03_1355 [Nocardia sp.]|uniref:hypothetical protein n=1 Tax=Nocardia sp. TaxID=1821 RepID=UPI0026094C87|nr:hypothetical protein [Nocardia sp.]MCU1641080.1 hypothetical protein [Nocardia sp.]
MFERLTIGAWVITTPGCSVRYVIDEGGQFTTLILGDTQREFEISLDAATLTEIVTQGLASLSEMTTPRNAEGGLIEPNVEAVIVRNPDGPTKVRVFINGIETPITDFTVDAGAGWTWDDWASARDVNLAAASPTARERLLAAYADPPGGEFITDREGTAWLK